MVTLTLTLEESNVVLATLAKAPFETVSGLIDKVREQAAPQLPSEQPEEGTKIELTYTFEKTDVEVVYACLAKAPYEAVVGLIAKIREQYVSQVSEEPESEAAPEVVEAEAV